MAGRARQKDLLLLTSFFVTTATALFPGATPEQGDIRHIYPISSLSIGVGAHGHVLPYLLGWIENIEWPKDRLNVDLYLLPDAAEDTSREQLQWWIGKVKPLFRSVGLHDTKSLDKGWQEDALTKSRQQQASFLLIWSADDLPSDYTLLNRLFKKEAPVVSTLLVGPPLNGDIWNLDDISQDMKEFTDTEEEIPFVSLPLALNLDASDSAYLTFDAGNLRGYSDSAEPLDVLAASARTMAIPLKIWRRKHIGWHFHDGFPLKTRKRTLRYFIADMIADRGSFPLYSSLYVRAGTPEASKHGFEKIYVINLARRPERRCKMEAMCTVLGIDCEFFPAVDGISLPTEFSSLKQLPGYEDPFWKRPMKGGEIGCLLSHYKIWEEVVSLGLSPVLVLEDDGRFADGAFDSLRETLNDIDEKKFDWGLIYIGRKRLQTESHRELWVPEIKHLSTVGYSYWTIGYALSLQGAKDLLAGDPLSKLIPVDEYIPIMADVHTNRVWTEAYENRILKAFTVYPLLVYPQRYTFERGHVSDTEASEIHTPTTPSQTSQVKTEL